MLDQCDVRAEVGRREELGGVVGFVVRVAGTEVVVGELDVDGGGPVPTSTLFGSMS